MGAGWVVTSAYPRDENLEPTSDSWWAEAKRGTLLAWRDFIAPCASVVSSLSAQELATYKEGGTFTVTINRKVRQGWAFVGMPEGLKLHSYNQEGDYIS